MFLYDIMQRLKETTNRIIRILLKPVGIFFTVERANKGYLRRQNKLSLDKCEYLVARGIAKYVIKYKDQELAIHSAKSVDTNYMGGHEFRSLIWLGFNAKENMARHKLNLTDTEVQNRIIAKLKTFKKVKVEEIQLEKPQIYSASEYRCTYQISYRE